MIALIAAALTVAATHHSCVVPAAAFSEAELVRRELRAMERFGYCLCGPDGTVDWDPRPHRRGGYFMHPSCNRNGWDGRRYRTSSEGRVL